MSNFTVIPLEQLPVMEIAVGVYEHQLKYPNRILNVKKSRNGIIGGFIPRRYYQDSEGKIFALVATSEMETGISNARGFRARKPLFSWRRVIARIVRYDQHSEMGTILCNNRGIEIAHIIPTKEDLLSLYTTDDHVRRLNSDDWDKVTYFETVASLEKAKRIKKLTKESLEGIDLIFSQEGVQKVELLHVGSYVFDCIVYFNDGYTLPQISLDIRPPQFMFDDFNDERGALLPFYLNQRVLSLQAKKRLDLIGHPVKKEKRVGEKPILKK